MVCLSAAAGAKEGVLKLAADVLGGSVAAEKVPWVDAGETGGDEILGIVAGDGVTSGIAARGDETLGTAAGGDAILGTVAADPDSTLGTGAGGGDLTVGRMAAASTASAMGDVGAPAPASAIFANVAAFFRFVTSSALALRFSTGAAVPFLAALPFLTSRLRSLFDTVLMRLL